MGVQLPAAEQLAPGVVGPVRPVPGARAVDKDPGPPVAVAGVYDERAGMPGRSWMRWAAPRVSEGQRCCQAATGARVGVEDHEAGLAGESAALQVVRRGESRLSRTGHHHVDVLHVLENVAPCVRIPVCERGGTVALVLKLGRHEFADTDLLVMAIVNRTRDSFYDKGATWDEARALDRVRQVVAEGADIIDVGGVKAGPGEDVDAAEEVRRTAGFVAVVREEFPDVVISVDTWRSEVGREVCAAGADLLNDAWGGHDPLLAEVAAQFGAAIVCTHTGGLGPRTPPHRLSYDDVVASAIEDTVALAARAVSVGVDRRSVLIDPAHDFGKNTWHSLELTRRLDEMTATGWPVLVSLSNKDFVGEALDLPIGERLMGTLAATAISAWHGAQVYRVHEARETRQVLDMVASIKGTRDPSHVVRGLA